MTLQVLFANNAGTTLAAPITNTQTSITVTSGSGALFPSPATGQFFSLTLSVAGTPATFEITWCTARSGDTLTVLRAQEGTAALAFNAGDNAQNLVTAGDLNRFMQWGMDGLAAIGATANFTVPAGVYALDAEIWGGGAGGGGAGGLASAGCGGTAGGYSRAIIAVTPGQVIPVTVGAAGVGGGGDGSNGTNAGTTSFGSFISATGGTGGPGSASGQAEWSGVPPSGSGAGGVINMNGSGSLNAYLAGSTYFGSGGGSAPFSQASSGISASLGSTPGAPGGGGGGGASNGAPSNGSTGGVGLCIIRW